MVGREVPIGFVTFVLLLAMCAPQVAGADADLGEKLEFVVKIRAFLDHKRLRSGKSGAAFTWSDAAPCVLEPSFGQRSGAVERRIQGVLSRPSSVRGRKAILTGVKAKPWRARPLSFGVLWIERWTELFSMRPSSRYRVRSSQWLRPYANASPILPPLGRGARLCSNQGLIAATIALGWSWRARRRRGRVPRRRRSPVDQGAARRGRRHPRSRQRSPSCVRSPSRGRSG